MEYCTGGDLLNVIKDSIKTKNRIELETIRSILFQILRAVAFMSARRVIHKDLKPENIMLVPTQAKTSGPIIKVIDFGLSELFALDQETSNMVAGTAFYMAPEIFRPPFNNKCDVWSCGVIAFFLATGYLPFFGATVAEVKSNILYRRLQWPATFARTENPLEIAPDFKAFIERLMEKDPALRPSAVEALRDPWISQNGISMEISRGVAMNIVCFSRLSFLKRVVINLIAHIWHFSEFENIIEMFSALDTGNNGMVPVASLASAIEHKGFKSIDAWTAAKSLDLSGSGTITYTSFTAGVILPLIDSDKEILRCVFNSFNPILKDYITISAIYDVLVGRRCVMSGSAHAIKPDGLKDFTHMIEGEITVTHLSPDNFKAEKSSASIGGLTSKTLGISFTDFRNWLLTTA
jgi:calcium-dependent protein kinase